jgi:hypothetical protein
MDDTVSSPEVKIDRTLLSPPPVDDFADLFKRVRAVNSFALRKRYWKKLDTDLINQIFAATINGCLVIDGSVIGSEITDATRLFLTTWSEGRTRIGWARGGTYVTLPDYRKVRVSLWKGGLFWVWGWKDNATERWVRVKPWGSILDVARLIFRRPEPEEFVDLVNEEVKPVWDRIKSGQLRVDHREISWEERYEWVRAAKPVVLPFYKAAGLVTSVARRAPTAKRLWEALPEEVRDVLFDFSSEEHREFLRLAEVEEKSIGTDYFRVRRHEPGNGTFVCILET